MFEQRRWGQHRQAQRRPFTVIAGEHHARYQPSAQAHAAHAECCAGDAQRGDVAGHGTRGTAGHGKVDLAAALAGLSGAVEAFAGVDVPGASDRELLDAAVALQALTDQVSAAQLRVLAEADARDAYGADGAVTLASWLRARTHMDPGDAKRRCHAATRLRQLPALAGALAAGEVTFAHVAAITDAAVPNRMAAIQAVEPFLVTLARNAPPRDVRVALARVRDIVDPDGADDPPAPPDDGPDPRRHFHAWRTIDGMVGGKFLLDQLAGEAVLTLVDVLDQPDPPDTPPEQRRSPAQRRADAFGQLARRLLDIGDLPSVAGNHPHVTVLLDLAAALRVTPDSVAALLGDGLADLDADTLAEHAQRLADLGHRTADTAARHDDAPATSDDDTPHAPATIAGDGVTSATVTGGSEANARGQPGSGDAGPFARTRSPLRLRWTGEAPLDILARLGPRLAVQVVLTCGPWRVVNVGRRMRTLPGWLRLALEWIHGHCRGPDCDRPAVWCEAHHEIRWADNGDTNLNDTVPVCKDHHDLVTTGKAHVVYNADDGTCTWTLPNRQQIITHPYP